jgi:hypothetical protein
VVLVLIALPLDHALIIIRKKESGFCTPKRAKKKMLLLIGFEITAFIA